MQRRSIGIFGIFSANSILQLYNLNHQHRNFIVIEIEHCMASAFLIMAICLKLHVKEPVSGVSDFSALNS